jgi:hypothetical protein
MPAVRRNIKETVEVIEIVGSLRHLLLIRDLTFSKQFARVQVRDIKPVPFCLMDEKGFAFMLQKTDRVTRHVAMIVLAFKTPDGSVPAVHDGCMQTEPLGNTYVGIVEVYADGARRCVDFGNLRKQNGLCKSTIAQI